MKKQLFSFLLLIFFFCKISAQDKEARKIFVFDLTVNCEEVTHHADVSFQELEGNPEAKLYFIYYEAKKQKISVYNKKTKQREDKLVNPKYGNALNRTKSFTFYLTKWRKAPKDKLVIVDGGFRENHELEIWLVPKNIEPPKPTPTVDEKDIKFRKGSPVPVKDCGQIILDYK